MTIKELQEKINNKKADIEKRIRLNEKLNNKLAKLTDKFDIEFCKDDIRDGIRKLETLKEQLVRLEQSLEKVKAIEESKPNRIQVIVDFLNQWKEKAMKFYLEEYKNYIADIHTLRNMSRETKEEYEEYRKFNSEIHNKYSNFVMDLYGKGDKGREEYLNKVLDREVENKYNSFIRRINKIDSNVINVDNLYIGKNGELNGYITCKTCNIKVQTIYAGGYNIQCLHYRVLVNKVRA